MTCNLESWENIVFSLKLLFVRVFLSQRQRKKNEPRNKTKLCIVCLELSPGASLRWKGCALLFLIFCRRWSLKLRQADVHQTSVWHLNNPYYDFRIFSVFLCFFFPNQKAFLCRKITLQLKSDAKIPVLLCRCEHLGSGTDNFPFNVSLIFYLSLGFCEVTLTRNTFSCSQSPSELASP